MQSPGMALVGPEPKLPAGGGSWVAACCFLAYLHARDFTYKDANGMSREQPELFSWHTYLRAFMQRGGGLEE